jgi:DNA polymerase-3 subunit alpha
LIGIFACSAVLAETGLEIEEINKENVVVAEIGNPVYYDLVINNLGEEDQFMIFTLEDYAGNYEFALFAKDFIQFERFIAQDRLLYIQGSYQSKNKHTDQMVFKIQSIELLTELLEERTKELRLRLNLSHLNLETVDYLEDLFDQYKGNKKVILEVYDEQDRVQLDFLSRKVQLTISKALVMDLSKVENIGFKLII